MSEPPDAPLVDKLDKLCDRIVAALEREPGPGGGPAPERPKPGTSVVVWPGKGPLFASLCCLRGHHLRWLSGPRRAR